jgi:hypothetical protein
VTPNARNALADARVAVQEPDTIAHGVLHRYWLIFEGDAYTLPAGLAMGCGVTAFSSDQAADMIRHDLLGGEELPPVARVVEDVEVSALDPCGFRVGDGPSASRR